MKNKFPCLTCKHHFIANIALGSVKSSNKEFPDIKFEKVIDCCNMYLSCDIGDCDYYENNETMIKLVDIAREFIIKEGEDNAEKN